jgi:RNA polymerase sigma-70 factor (ECF subfamily)
VSEPRVRPPETEPRPPALCSDGSLLRRYRDGEEEAATALYRRYARRLRALAARRTGGDLAGRFDADDVVQSVFRTFFQAVRRRAYDVPPGGEIWGLLLVLALNKIRNQADYHRAAKRDVSQTAADPDLVRQQALSRDEHAAVFLRMVLDEQMADLPESNRAIVRLRMEGYEVGEIAERAGRSRRTVERVLRDFRDRLAGP